MIERVDCTEKSVDSFCSELAKVAEFVSQIYISSVDIAEPILKQIWKGKQELHHLQQ